MGSGIFSRRSAGPGRGAARAAKQKEPAVKPGPDIPAPRSGVAVGSAAAANQVAATGAAQDGAASPAVGVPGGTALPAAAAETGKASPAAAQRVTAQAATAPGAAGRQPGTFMVIWSPAGDSAGELLWHVGLCLAAKKRAAILADLDLYTPGLAVAANMLVPGKQAPGVLDACLTQQLPALAVSIGPDGSPVVGRRMAPRLLSPEGQPLLRVLPGLLDLRGIDMLVPAHLEALVHWLKGEAGWRIVAVSASVDCAATLACLAVADRLVLHVPQHAGRSAAVAQFWLARAAHLLESLPGVPARPELWLPGWDGLSVREVGANLKCPAHALPAGGRRRMDVLAQLLGLKPEPPAPAPRGEIVAVR